MKNACSARGDISGPYNLNGIRMDMVIGAVRGRVLYGLKS